MSSQIQDDENQENFSVPHFPAGKIQFNEFIQQCILFFQKLNFHTLLIFQIMHIMPFFSL